jgi:transposase
MVKNEFPNIQIYAVSGKYTKNEREKLIRQKKTDFLDAYTLAKSFDDVKTGLIKPLPDLRKYKRLRELITQYDFLTDEIRRQKRIMKEIENNELSCVLETMELKREHLKKEIEKEIGNFPEWLILKRVPGVGLITIAYLAAYIMDINRFDNEKQFKAYVGAVKRAQKSGKMDYEKTNFFFHRKIYNVLWMATLGAIKMKKRNKVKTEYNKQKAKGKHYKVARKHALRVLVELIYKELKKEEKNKNRKIYKISR